MAVESDGNDVAPLWVTHPERPLTHGQGTTHIYECKDNPDIRLILLTKIGDDFFMDIAYPENSSVIAERFLETESGFEQGDAGEVFPLIPNVGVLGTSSRIYGAADTKTAIDNAITFIDGFASIPEVIKSKIGQVVTSLAVDDISFAAVEEARRQDRINPLDRGASSSFTDGFGNSKKDSDKYPSR